jgi:DNA polymerase (family 10)
MTPLDASEVAKLLTEYGRRTALAGGNPYRSKAYLRAAESLAALAEPLGRIVSEGRLREISGIGEAIADIITRLHRTGTHSSLERMRGEIPEGVLEMLSVPGLRPDEVLKLHKRLGVTSLAELQVAAGQDRIKNAKGLGPALQRKLFSTLVEGPSAGSRAFGRLPCTRLIARKLFEKREWQRSATGGDDALGAPWALASGSVNFHALQAPRELSPSIAADWRLPH